MKFYYDKEIEDMIGGVVDDLLEISNIPTLDMGFNVFWQMISIKEEHEATKWAEKFFESTFNELYNGNAVATIIRFKWKMTNINEPENVLVYFLVPPDELKKKLNSILKMKAFW